MSARRRRWCDEDYLRAPFGVYGDRGPQVAARLPQWGQAVFTALFGTGPARDAYVAARAVGDVEIVFRSSVPARLGLPWELLCDPAHPTPVALNRVGMSRSLLHASAARSFAVGGERLRVLMVISRPRGADDVGYRMDGHGVLAGRSAAGSGPPLTFDGAPEQRVLVFEKPGGGADEVPAGEVARVLAGAAVPVVVLNACQSGAVGSGPSLC